MAKGAVAAAAWISVALIIIAILWKTEIGDLLAFTIIILILLGIPFVLTLALFSKEILKSDNASYNWARNFFERQTFIFLTSHCLLIKTCFQV